MNIPGYSALFYHDESVEIGPLAVVPPDADDVDAGFMPGVTAAETVELARALHAWLGMHRRQHPKWHKEYRDNDPGGHRRWDKEKGKWVRLPRPGRPTPAGEAG